jgi:trehalose 6-phosphate synthase/phosphatase
MSQVIIVSNRLPISVKKEAGKLVFYRSAGGLATGLSGFVNRGQSRWIGWPGIASDELSEADRQAITERLAKQRCTPVFLTQKQLDAFYNGYSNSVLWPLFHNLGKRLPDETKRRAWWQAYRRANRQFTEAVASLAEPGSQVWVHDYQLMLVPQLLRARRPDSTIGYFLHIPFPDVRTFRRLPEAKKLLRGMLGADLVGFHTPGYVDNFLDNCLAAAIAVSQGREPVVDGRLVRVSDFPMGIDNDKYAAAIRSRSVKEAARRYRRLYGRRKVIVAVDRLDPSKGLLQRLQAYALLLERYPRLHGRVIFAMVAAPSRTDVPAYRRLAKQLQDLVDEINAKYGTANWQPIDYMNVLQPFEEVTALFQIADVAFITPLSDGMNLAAKEFVASQRGRGVLVLSETAGAAEELRDALLVDPKRPEAVVAALDQALTMRRRELRRRLRSMQRQLSDNSVQDWAKRFVNTLQQPVPLPGPRLLVRTVKGRLESDLINSFRQAKKRLLLLDYDGSLVPFSEDYEKAGPGKTLLHLLESLSSDKNTDIVLVSGRSAADLQRWFGSLPVTLIAEHGATIRKAGHKAWWVIEKVDNEWKQLLLPVLEKYAALAPGAKVEVKPHSLVWHYRTVPPYYAQKYAIIIKRVLRPTLKKYGLELVQGNKVLEIKNPFVTKGMAVQDWLERDYPFILAVGDDITDEDIFAVLPLTAYSIKVGRGRTLARYRLPSSKQIIRLLRKLS